MRLITALSLLALLSFSFGQDTWSPRRISTSERQGPRRKNLGSDGNEHGHSNVPSEGMVGGNNHWRKEENTRINEIEKYTDDEVNRMRLEVLDHQPCGPGNYPYGARQERIRLPSRKITRSSTPGCYKLRGRLRVRRTTIGGVKNMHLEIKSKPDPDDIEAPEPCHDPEPDGCDGIGSCLYCKPCEIEMAANEARNLNFDTCDTDLIRRQPKRMSFEFCLPTRKKFFESKGFSEDTWLKVNGDGGKVINKVGVFMTARFFNRDIRKNVAANRRWESIARSKLRIPEGDPLPKYERQKLPFNTFKNNRMIGCHVIVGNLYLTEDE